MSPKDAASEFFFVNTIWTLNEDRNVHFESVSNPQDVLRRCWSREKECTNFHRTAADEHVVAEAADFLSCFEFVRLKLFMEKVD